MKDNFSSGSDRYATFRPVYPEALYDFLLPFVPGRQAAWDCGTGNGQVAQVLAGYFDQVYATDISKQQIEQARPHKKIRYSVQSAESTSFPDNTFDLITVAQAIHWFDFEAFYREVNRTLKHRGIIAVTGYGLFRSFPEADRIITNFYHRIIGPFWDPERVYIDEHYQTIPFPFPEIEAPHLYHKVAWDFNHLAGYLGTWSAVKHYQQQKGRDPFGLIYDDLKKCWGPSARTVKFPVLLRVGRVEKA